VPEEELQQPVAQPADAVVQNKVSALGGRRCLRWWISHVLI
jgi:hypothetical protein